MHYAINNDYSIDFIDDYQKYDSVKNKVKIQMQIIHQDNLRMKLDTVDAFKLWLSQDADHDNRQIIHRNHGEPVYGYSEDEWNAFKFAWEYVHGLIEKEIKDKIKEVVDDDYVCDTLDEIIESTKVVI